MKDFFEKLDFTFGSADSDIKPSEIVISENKQLTQKLKGNVFLFETKSHTSFYAITIPLEKEDFFEVRRYIWNENKCDLYFITENFSSKFTTSLFYSKTNPRKDALKIASFSGDENGRAELEKIKKWQFEKGTFWLTYADFLSKIKKYKAQVDKELVIQLKELRKKLYEELKNIDEKDTLVQALIDRTLFIKFLEDNHIINETFYKHNFTKYSNNNKDILGYKYFLEQNDIASVNKLFGLINNLFNNVLFAEPKIQESYITNELLTHIHRAISKTEQKGQLSLFDFRFDVIPTEFISHIYEVFFEANQLDEGIYYTPSKLAHLIIDDTIKKTGSILDPSCGSGMFLVLAFRKLLSYNPPKTNDVFEIIEHKNKIIKDYIFGIEKQNNARRLSIFSLYLEILKDINQDDIAKFIKQKLENGKLPLTPVFPYDFSENIIAANSLEVAVGKIAHENKKFDYIVGNPPFLQIEKKHKKQNIELNFIKKYKTTIGENILKAKDIISKNQISQSFMLKIKDWAKSTTRFGFVQNSSNFYATTPKFQNFFFKYYRVEKFYELSRVRDILFKKTKENVVVTIFENQNIDENVIDYYPVKMELFSKTFDLLVIQEDKKIQIKQNNILNGNAILRDYLMGNTFDLKLLDKLAKKDKLEHFLLKYKRSSFKGLDRATNKVVQVFFREKNINTDNLDDINNEYARINYLNDTQTTHYNTKYIYRPEKKIIPFRIMGQDGFMNIADVKKPFFQRPRNLSIYEGKKILFNRYGKKIKASFSKQILFFSNLIYNIKLQDEHLYYLFTAILNSDLIDYFLTLKFRKRIGNNYANLTTKAIKNIPIPKYLDEDLVAEISEISKKLTDGELEYEGKTKEKLNDLIYDLYELNILEIKRIRHFYTPKHDVTDDELEFYKNSLIRSIQFFFKNPIEIEHYQNKNLPLDLVVVAVYFNGTEKNESRSKKTLLYRTQKMLEHSSHHFLAMPEKIYGDNCIYIIKTNAYHNWTTTKAFEDGQEILKKTR